MDNLPVQHLHMWNFYQYIHFHPKHILVKFIQVCTYLLLCLNKLLNNLNIFHPSICIRF
ncbi:unnamed protein product [Paramecium sonneborni]|uniref:Uncharacterized protein n=1 Tax=Paramecium sonneborni TaxID=65129 RepID=A0A8S1L7X3_9CILI|nr:unnamed protein product [Paramecium sonneborni]